MGIYTWRVGAGDIRLASNWALNGAVSATVPGGGDGIVFAGQGGSVTGVGSVDTVEFDPVSSPWSFTGQLVAVSLAGSGGFALTPGANITLTGRGPGLVPSAGSVSGVASVNNAALNSFGTLAIGSIVDPAGSAGYLGLFNSGSSQVLNLVVGEGTSGTVALSGAGARLSVVGNPNLPPTNNTMILGTAATPPVGSLQAGTGTVTATGGAAVSVDGSLILAFNGGTTGSMTLTDRATLAVKSVTTVGSSGTGTMAVSGGSVVSTATGGATAADGSINYDFVGGDVGSVGTLALDGAGTRWNSGNQFIVGNFGTGTATVTNSATLAVASRIVAGQLAGSNGTLNVRGGTAAVYGDILVANAAGAAGSIAVTGGGTLTDTLPGLAADYALRVGLNGAQSGQGSASGTVIVSGAGSLLDMGANGAEIGLGGTGVLLVSGGGTVRLAGVGNGIASLAVGRLAGSTGGVSVDSAGSQIQLTGGLLLGEAGFGSVSVTNGAVLSLASRGGADVSTVGGSGTGVITVESGSFAGLGGQVNVGTGSGAGTVAVSGAGSQYAGSGTAVLGGNGRVTATAGGAFRTAALVLAGNASLTVDGTGIYVVGTSAGTAGVLTVDEGRTLSGTGAVRGPIVGGGTIVAQGGTLALDSVTGGVSLGAAAGTLDVGAEAGARLDFSGAAGTIRLHAVAGASTVTAFGPGDVLDFAGTTSASVSGNTVTVNSAAGTATFTILPAQTNGSFGLSSDGNGGTMLTAFTDNALPQFATVFGAGGNDAFTDTAGNQVYAGGGGADVLAVNEVHRGDIFTLGDNGDVTFAHANQVDAVRGVATIQFIDGQVTFDPNSAAAAVTRLYQAGLGRLPDQAGLTFWTANVQQGVPLANLATGFLTSPEFTARFGSGLSNSDFVTRIYLNVLGRPPEQGGLAFWTGNLDNGRATLGQTLAGISESTENKGVTAGLVSSGIWSPDGNAQQVARLYDTALGRLPDAGGLSFWTKAIAAGTGTLQDLATSFTNSAEFVGRYGALDNRAFVQAVYGNALGRPGDQGGVDFWTGVLNAGTSRAAVTIGFSESPEHQNKTAGNILGFDAGSYGIKLAG